ncbi:phy rapidly regulated 1 [Actinidia rufa]|uniref:Phy rapidly regulated 1 n=1 Tax=Actinidia rufa TaxID=165716 RepID=A0A7J0DMX6_9ERIC|nr:phy rapidly regulated 1 [Actinidia rufa]
MDHVSKDSIPPTPFQTRETNTHEMFHEMGHTTTHSEPLATLHRVGRPGTQGRTPRRKKVLKEVQSRGGTAVDDDKAEVDRKIMALQRIVPGGESLGVDKLFEETAGYILVLKGQLKAMRLLTALFEGLPNPNPKLGAGGSFPPLL